MNEQIKQITREEAIRFIMPRHYAGRIPPVTIAFGWYIDNQLKAVSTFGKPASPNLCREICGEKYASNVYELNRLCRDNDLDYPLSHFVARCLNEIKKFNWIVVSFSDTAMNHHGYIYQATNFLYTGETKSRVDRVGEGNSHPRHANTKCNSRCVRSIKHCYVFFATNSKGLKKEWRRSLKYPTIPYPKGDNSNYTLGERLKTEKFDEDGNIIEEKSFI